MKMKKKMKKKNEKKNEKKSEKENEEKSSNILEKIVRTPIYPITLKPNQKINIQLIIRPSQIGYFNPDIQICSNWETMKKQYLKYKINGSIQPIIKFKLNSVDFGIVPYQSKKSYRIEFKNEGTETLRWHLKFDRTFYSIIKNENIEILNNFEDDDNVDEFFDDNDKDLLIKDNVEQLSHNLHPFSFFPTKGRLNPGYTQYIEVYFNPSLPNSQYRSVLNLYTENIGFKKLWFDDFKLLY